MVFARPIVRRPPSRPVRSLSGGLCVSCALLTLINERHQMQGGGSEQGSGCAEQHVVREPRHDSNVWSEIPIARAGDLEVLETHGAFASESRLFLFDSGNSRLITFSIGGKVIAMAGRRGQGPGEFSRVGGPRDIPRTRSYIAVRGDSVFVTDGQRLSVFSANLEFKGVLRVPTSLISPHQNLGIFASRDGLFVVTDSLDLSSGRRRLHVTALSGQSGRIVSYVLPSVATTKGHVFQGPDEARPLVGFFGDCLLISDGTSDSITIFNLHNHHSARIGFHISGLPTRPKPKTFLFPSFISKAGSPAEGGQINLSQSPQPRSVRRWRSLRVSPRGELWLEPVIGRKEDEPLKIVVVDLTSLRARIAQVSSFPIAIGWHNEVFSLVFDRD